MPRDVSDPKGAIPIMAEFIASAVDAFLQEWSKAAAEGDGMEFMLATAKLEQAASEIRQVMDRLSESQIADELDLKNYNSATHVVHEYLQKRFNEIISGVEGDEAPDTIRTFN